MYVVTYIRPNGQESTSKHSVLEEAEDVAKGLAEGVGCTRVYVCKVLSAAVRKAETNWFTEVTE